MLTLAAAVEKLQLMAQAFSADNPWKRRSDLMIVAVMTDPLIDSTDEFCDTIERASIKNHAEEFGKLWDFWGLQDGEATRDLGSGKRCHVCRDQAGVQTPSAEDPPRPPVRQP